MIEVFIPSRSRWNDSKTMRSLHRSRIKFTVVVPTDQQKKYKTLVRETGGSLFPCTCEGIAATRYFIGQQVRNEKFIMLDDDLKFFYRTKDSVRLFSIANSNPKWIWNMLEDVERALDKYAHAAISARGGNQNRDYPYELCSRPIRALAYRKTEFLACEHGRVDIMEDFDITLQLLRKGYQNCLITKYAQDHLQTQHNGGCSDYRTHALHARNVSKLAKLHHPFVKLKTVKNKTGGEFGKRLEATIYWQKAWEYSVKEIM